MRSPFNKASKQTTAFMKPGRWKCGYHSGVDRVCSTDMTIVAIAPGTVQRVNDCGASYGNHVVYRTTDGIVVLCAHLRDKPAVKVGDKLTAGQKIGVMGNTGNSSGPHLHIELQRAARWQYAKNLLDPNAFIDWDDYRKDEFDLKKWKNGSTAEPVYGSVKDCKAKTGRTDSLPARAEATCAAVIDGCYLIYYAAGSTKKCGFVAYHGGVK